MMKNDLMVSVFIHRVLKMSLKLKIISSTKHVEKLHKCSVAYVEQAEVSSLFVFLCCLFLKMIFQQQTHITLKGLGGVRLLDLHFLW